MKTPRRRSSARLLHEMTAAVSDKEKKLELYNHVVEKASLNDIQLTHVDFDVKQNFYTEPSKRKLGYEVQIEHIHFDAQAGIGAALIDLTVKGTLNRKNGLRCRAKYIVAYDGLHDCEDEAVEVFLSRVAPFACFPYFRTLFAGLDWSSGLKLPPLPVFKEAPRAPSRDKPKKLASKAKGS